jgi:hypothetical protein
MMSSFATSRPAAADVLRLRDMVDELRRQRNSCEPKSNQTARYLHYSNAVSSFNWIIDDLLGPQDHGSGASAATGLADPSDREDR